MAKCEKRMDHFGMCVWIDRTLLHYELGVLRIHVTYDSYMGCYALDYIHTELICCKMFFSSLFFYGRNAAFKCIFYYIPEFHVLLFFFFFLLEVRIFSHVHNFTSNFSSEAARRKYILIFFIKNSHFLW